MAGAEYLGFVFAESTRKISPEKVRLLTTGLPKDIKKVGVFVSPKQAAVERIITVAGLDLVQIHGENRLASCSLPIIKAINVTKDQSFSNRKYPYLLLDAPPEKYMGGTGKTFDWNLVQDQSLPKEKLWIAGGLNAANVTEAIHRFNPQVVDVSSGVETNGEKDLHKIFAFCRAVNRADKESY
ncbi:hypothetical protein RV04_GL001312 [Enterococcus hermanniensis]|uniref:N-(5'-phosphoribosyl)anthranilate isomerase n=2 Tax=Enterococcus hermanniensis TaxID=249189 RepID=A0A1L8TPA4_9ENTE|nr:hypothetical protein RV04_GL001312 [Enterococcus hermanniensis]